MSKYLDKVGLEHYHDLIKDGLFEYIEGTQNSATSTWTGVSTSPSLSSGKLIIYHLPYAGGSAVPTLNLTLPDNTTTGAKTVGTRVGTSYSAGSNIILVYTGTAWDVVEADGSNLIANRAVISDANGKLAESNVTSTELGYLSGVTSGVQNQIDSKQNSVLDDGALSDYFDMNEDLSVNEAMIRLVEKLDAKCLEIKSSKTISFPDILEGSTISIIAVGGGGGATSYVGGGSGFVKFKRNVPVQSSDVFSVVVGAGGNGQNNTYSEASVGGVTAVMKNGTTIISANGGGISPNGWSGADGAAGSGGRGYNTNAADNERHGGRGYQFGGGGAGGNYKMHKGPGRGGDGGPYGGGGGGEGTVLSSTAPNNGGNGGLYGGNGGRGGYGTFSSGTASGEAGGKGTDLSDFYMPSSFRPDKKLKSIATTTYSGSISVADFANNMIVIDAFEKNSESVGATGGGADGYTESMYAGGGGGGGGGFGSSGGSGGKAACRSSSTGYSGAGGGGGGFGAAATGGTPYSVSNSTLDTGVAGGSGGGFFGPAGRNSTHSSGGAGGFFASGGIGGSSNAKETMGGTGAGGGGSINAASSESAGRGGDGVVYIFYCTKGTSLSEDM